MNSELAKVYAAQLAMLKAIAVPFLQEFWGDRCPDYEESCFVCQKWRALDELLENPFT